MPLSSLCNSVNGLITRIFTRPRVTTGGRVGPTVLCAARHAWVYWSVRWFVRGSVTQNGLIYFKERPPPLPPVGHI